MLSEIINPISVLISLTAVFGVFIHDTQIDSALAANVSTPAIVSDYSSSPIKLLHVDQHIHFDSASFSNNLRTQQPATQPRNEDEKKYIAQRRLMGNTFGNEYSWPSI